VEFELGFGKGDINAGFPAANALEEILKRERCLPGPWRAFDEIDAVRAEAAVQDVVQAGDARGDSVLPILVDWYVGHTCPCPLRQGRQSR